MAGCILAHPDCARFFDIRRCAGRATKPAVSLVGAVPSIDRLVCVDDAGIDTWWVLDWLQHHARALEPTAQLIAAYRGRVRQASGPLAQRPSCAGDGRLIESDGLIWGFLALLIVDPARQRRLSVNRCRSPQPMAASARPLLPPQPAALFTALRAAQLLSRAPHRQPGSPSIRASGRVMLTLPARCIRRRSAPNCACVR